MLTKSLHCGERAIRASMRPMLAAETLQLARVREIKNRRFKHALRLAFGFYAWSVAVFLMLRNC